LLRPVFVALVLALVLLAGGVLAIGPERAWAAVQDWLGFLPGFGWVEDAGSVLVLEAPGSQVREGVLLTVQEAIADAARTVVTYQAEGLSIEAANSQGEGAPGIGSLAAIRLPDGTRFEQTGGESRGWGSGYQARLVFPPLPEGEEAFTLVIPRLDGMPPGAAPEDWQFHLRFRPAPPSLTLAPVFEATEVATTPFSEASPTPPPYGVTLHLEQIVELEDGYILVGHTRWGDLDSGLLWLNPFGWMTLTDAHGDPVPIEEESSLLEAEVADPAVASWAWRLRGKHWDGPLVLSLETAEAAFPADADFQVNVGLGPQTGQEWRLDKTLDVAGHTVTVETVEAIEDSFGSGYAFSFSGDPQVLSLGMAIEGTPPSGGGGGGGEGVFNISLIWATGRPSGLLKVTIDSVNTNVHGPWSVVWNPPLPAGNVPLPTSTTLASPCLRLEPEKSAESYGSSQMPEGLTGRLLLYGPMAGHPEYVISVVKLDGGDRRFAATGTWPAFSRDGNYVAYSAQDGLHVLDLRDDTDRILPGTNDNDYHPVWSPSGDTIAFVRGAGAFDVYVIGNDGAGLRAVTSGSEYEELAGWSPDGTAVIYSATTGGQQAIWSVDLERGLIRRLFALEGLVKAVGAAVSPDEAQIAFRDVLFGQPAGGLFLAALDGSGRRLVAELGFGGMSSPVWSPDGAWLAARLPGGEGAFDLPVPILLQPETCRLVVLSDLTGEVMGWAP
jgi:hypothetical protein